MKTTFKVGQEYATRSACDYECVFKFKVLKRTEKTVTIVGDLIDSPKRVKIHNFSDVESFSPYGSFSMAPSISADQLRSEYV